MATWNNNNIANFKSYQNQTQYDTPKFTFGCMLNTQSQPTSSTFISKSIGNTAGDLFLGTASGNGNQLRAFARFSDNVTHAAIDSGTISNGTWYHAWMRWDGTTLSLWRDGTSVATNVPGGGVTQAATCKPALFARDVDGGVPGNKCDAYLAEFGWYGTNLTDEEMVSLGKGVSPLLVRPASLLIYDKLIDLNSNDLILGLGSFTGTCLAEPHAPVMYPARRSLVTKTAAGGSTHYTAPITETWTTYSETVATKYNAKVTGVADTVTLSGSLAAILGAHIAPTDTVALSDSEAVKYNAKVTGVADTVALSEVLTSPSGSAYTASITEAWTTYSASVAATMGAHLAPTDTVTLSESLAAHQNMVNPLSDTVALSDSVAAKYNAKTTAGDTITLSETLAASRGAHVAPTDTVALSETIAAKYNAKVAESDTMLLFETLTNPASTGVNSRFFLVQ